MLPEAAWEAMESARAKNPEALLRQRALAQFDAGVLRRRCLARSIELER